MFRALNGGRSSSPDMLPTYITTNPLRDLPPLPKVHHLCEGIDPSYMLGPWPHSNWTREVGEGVHSNIPPSPPPPPPPPATLLH